jgi:hypothetical protein
VVVEQLDLVESSHIKFALSQPDGHRWLQAAHRFSVFSSAVSFLS